MLPRGDKGVVTCSTSKLFSMVRIVAESETEVIRSNNAIAIQCQTGQSRVMGSSTRR